jgi:Dyp-type peroxidase family
MKSLHELTEPIAKYEEVRELLENLQGNILQGHGRDYSIYIFLHFKDSEESKTKVKKWIKRFARRITSAQQQFNEIEQYRQYRIPGRLFTSFFLSAFGYSYLGFDIPKNNADFDIHAFPYGMQAAQSLLNDPSKRDWEEGYRDTIHAMVMLADDDERFLLREARRLLDHVQAYADIRAVEQGRVMRNSQDYPVEHFGYIDGRSQPLFFQRDIERERQKGDGINIWPPNAGPNLVLVPDPFGKKEAVRGITKYYHSGSYLVFRKLEQNVRAFKERTQELAKALGLSGEDVGRAGALVIGRFEDGTPVALQSAAGRSAPVPNNFTYDEDREGLKCPIQAHMRKVNRRQRWTPRIVRRGVTYGKRDKEPKDNPSLDELPSRGVGLLFMCYQSNIEKQFQVLQNRWANNPGFPKEGTGIDPIIGQPSKDRVGPQNWPIQWGEPRSKSTAFEFGGFVTLKGGEYFFAPSLYFLRRLGD